VHGLRLELQLLNARHELRVVFAEQRVLALELDDASLQRITKLFHARTFKNEAEGVNGSVATFDAVKKNAAGDPELEESRPLGGTCNAGRGGAPSV
jgi:hypothetical protein